MRHATVLLLAAAAFASSAAAASGDTARGREKSALCVACHGLEGIAPNPTFPHISGQNAAYLQVQLEAFREGSRYHALMTPVAQSLSDEDIADLASYFSSIGPLAAAFR